MIRDIGESIGNAVLENVGWAAGRVQESAPLPADVYESDDAYLVVFDAPGATASDVQVRYVDDAVEVRVDRFREFHEGFEMRFPGRGLALDGRVALPGDAAVDAEAATATLTESGTLEVRVPKVDDAGSDAEKTDAEGTDGDGTDPEGSAAEGSDEDE